MNPAGAFVFHRAGAELAFWLSFAGWSVVEWRLARRDRRRAGTGEAREDRGSVHVLVLLSWLGILLAFVAAWWLGGGGWTWVAVGLALIWLGIGLRAWAVRVLGRFFRRVVVVQAGHRVVSDGPYRLLRHPAYTGSLLTALGIGVALGNWAAVACSLALPLTGHLWRIRVEEAALARDLGDDYRAYMRRTWRLLPGIW